MESMGVASGCGCKEVYRFTIFTYPYSSCICSFLQHYQYFLFIVKCFSFLFSVATFCNKNYVLIFFPLSINTYRRLWASHGSHMKGCT